MRLPLSVLSISLLLTIVACKKDNPHQTVPAVSSVPDTTIHINYIYLVPASQVQQGGVIQYELILSSGTSILLDTIAAVNTPLIANIKLDTLANPLVDMTVITTSGGSSYNIITEKAIKPAAWSLLPGTDSSTGLPAGSPAPNLTTAYLYYTHVPVPQNEPYFFSGSNNSTQTGLFNNTSNDQLVLDFGQYQGFDAYLSFPNKALYNFHPMSGSATDTVNLSTMDTAVSLRIAHPSLYTNTSVYVSGFPDSTNLQKEVAVSVYQPGGDTIAGADVVYPGKKTFQKYQVEYTASDIGYADIARYSDLWADSVNPAPFLPDNTYFNILSNANNDFSVQFTKMAPGFYTIQYTGTNLMLTLNAPADSTVLQPLGFLTALHSKWLKNENLASIQSASFSFYYAVIHGQPQPTPLAPISNQYATQASSLPTSSYIRTF